MDRIELRAMRIKAGLSQAELGRLAGYDDSMISRLESGSREMLRRHQEHLRRVLAEALPADKTEDAA
jgi:transcriptional regulator with XRE-family HTH domain